jgi:4-hydroxy-4-methyl-2-oxoglutarate aldolase
MEPLGALAGPVRTAHIVDAMGRVHNHRCHLLDQVSPPHPVADCSVPP